MADVCGLLSHERSSPHIHVTRLHEVALTTACLVSLKQSLHLYTLTPIFTKLGFYNKKPVWRYCVT